MKRIIIYSMIAAVTFAAAGGSTMFLLQKADANKSNSNKNPDIDEEFEDEEIPEEEPTNQELFIENIINGNLNIQNLDLVVYNLEPNKNLAVNFKGCFDYKGLELAQNNFDNFKIQGTLGAKYAGLDEKIDLTFLPGKVNSEETLSGLTNGTCYFTYMDHSYSFGVKTVFDVLDSLQVFGIPTDKLFNETGAVKEGINEDKETSFDPMALLSSIKESETETGFDYSLAIPEIGTVVLESTKDNKLSGVRTEGKLNISGTELSVNAKVISEEKSVFNENFKKGESLEYIPSIIRKIGEIYNSNAINTGFNIKFRNENDTKAIDLDLNGELALDFESTGVEKFTDLSKSDLLNGKYALTINPVGTINGVNQVNSIKALYAGENVYFKVNDLAKGKLANASIQDIINIVSSKVQVPELNGALTKISTFFESSDIVKLINGDFSAIKRIIKDFELTENKFSFVLNSGSFNLADGEIKIIINFDESHKLNSIELNGLHYETYFLDFKLNLLEFKSLNTYFENLDNFKDYSGAIDIYNSVSKLVEGKTVDADYNISILNSDPSKNFEFAGNLKGDFNNVDFNNVDTFKLGSYALDVDTEIFGHRRTINADYKENQVYLNYNNLITNKVADTTLVDIFNVVDNLLSKENPDGTISKPSDAFTKTSTVLDEILAKYQPLINEIKTGNLLVLEDYISLDKDNLNKDLLDLRIAPNGDKNYSILIKLSNTNNALKSISVSGVELNGTTLNFNISLNDYNPRLVDETLYAPIDNLFYGIKTFSERPAFNTTLEASIVDYVAPGEVPPVKTINNDIILYGNANVDIPNTDFYGELNIKTQLPVDHNVYHHRLAFDYSKTSDNLDTELLAKYTNPDANGNDPANKGMYINMNGSKISSLITQIQDIPENNVIWALLQRVKEAKKVLPLDEIIGGKYEEIFNDYLKCFKITEAVTEVNRDQVVNVVVDGRLLGVDGEFEFNIYIDAINNDITNVEIVNLRFENKVINLFASIDEFDSTKVDTRLKTAHPKETTTYVDFNTFDLLLQIGINTTNTNSYHLTGNLRITDTMAITLVDSTFDIRLHVLDNGKVHGYIYVNSGDNCKVEIAILENGDAIFHKIGKAGSRQINEMFIVNQEEATNNILFYILKYTLDCSNLEYKLIYDNVGNQASSNDSINIRYDSLFSEAPIHIPNSQNENAGDFKATIDLGAILNLGGAIQFKPVDLTVSYDLINGNKKLSSFSIKNKEGSYVVDIIKIIKVDLDFNVTSHEIVNEEELFKKYVDIITYYNENKTKFDYNTITQTSGFFGIKASYSHLVDLPSNTLPF